MTTTTGIVEIGGIKVGSGHPAFIIAEAGFNHNGSLKTALELVDAAADAGADAIKFQSYTVDELLAPSVTYRDVFLSAALGVDAHSELAARAKQRGIVFASTPFDPAWVKILCDLDAGFLKIASMDLTTPSLLKAVAATGKPVIVSTGLSTMEEVRAAVAFLRQNHVRDIVLLHCVSLYPAPIEAVNLRAIPTLQNEFKIPVGFSDHTLGIEVPVWAVALGACCIEKHFTLDRNAPGPDHKLSLDPAGLKDLVKSIRTLEKTLGSGEKAPTAEELPLKAKTRRGIMICRSLKKGSILSSADLRPVRPIPEPDGIGADMIERVVGCRLSRDLPEKTLLRRGDVENA